MSIDTSFKVKNGLEVPSMNTMLASNVVMPTIKPSLNFNFMKSEYLDSRITFTRNSIATRINSNGILETVSANTPRFDYDATGACKGLLIEDARTNYIRNNTMVGAVAGTPGTLPNNYGFYNPQSLTRTITAVGVENGITYIEVNVSGTATSATQFDIGTESTTSTVASSGQSWTHSAWLSQIGSATNASLRLIVSGRSGGTETEQTGIIPTLTASLNRSSVSRTFNNASTVSVYPYINIAVLAAGAVNITFRIGLPQLEQAGFSTSVIPTSNATVTRVADSATITTLTPWFNPVEGTLFAESMLENTQVGAPTNRYPGAAALNDGTLNNAVHLYFDINPSTSTRVSGQEIFVGGSSQIVGVYSTVLDNTPIRQAVAYKQSSSVGSAKGLIGSVAGAANVPVVNRLLLGANRGYSPLNGYLQRVSYYPARLTATELQALTA